MTRSRITLELSEHAKKVIELAQQGERKSDLLRERTDAAFGWAHKTQAGNIPCPGVSTFFGSYFFFAAWTVGQTGP